MTETDKLIKRIENYRDGHCVVQMDALLAEGGNPLVYKGRIDSCNQIIAALRRTAEIERLEQAGLLVVLPCKPNKTFLHRNYDTGALELNIELHDFDGNASELSWEEIDQCAYWE